MTKTRSMPVLAWRLGMNINDVEDAEKAGVEIDDINVFWGGYSLESMKDDFIWLKDFSESAWWKYHKDRFIQIPGGLIQLTDEAIERSKKRK